jgi:hypothetical protein
MSANIPLKLWLLNIHINLLANLFGKFISRSTKIKRRGKKGKKGKKERKKTK